MIDFYFYEGQLRSYLVQFCNIFAGLRVRTGKDECGEEDFITVPITIGTQDRVAAAIRAGNTQNKPFTLPAMSANLASIDMPDSRKGINVVDNRVFLPAGAVYPEGLRTLTRVMPIPYVMNCDLTVYASNTLQLHQMLEQIMMLFDPLLQIQTSDSEFDWTKITTVELIGQSNEENFPISTDRRVLQWTFSFRLPIYISAPVDIKDEMVRKIVIQMGDLRDFVVNEVGEDGEMIPFDPKYGVIEVTSRS